MKIFDAMFFILLVASPFCALAASDSEQSGYSCGESMEAEVWKLWDGNAKRLLADQLVDERLTKQGDTYALYDLQTYLHNLVDMAGRCGRQDRLLEIARSLSPIFVRLETAPRGKGQAWVCRGGSICNDRNRLLGVEVQLTSVQFLGLASSVAAYLAEAAGEDAGKFRRLVVQTALDHLSRWSNASALEHIGKEISSKAAGDVAPDPGLAFEDKQLWMIAIYSNLARIISSNPQMASVLRPGSPEAQRLGRHFSLLLQLFGARVSFDTIKGQDGRATIAADIDRGFWRANKDNRYAGYTDSAKPVECVPKQNGRYESVLKVAADKPVPLEGSGWDLSHARRMVHAIDAVEYGRIAVRSVFGISESAMPRSDIRTAFANQLLTRVWNGDSTYPLFKNFWGGANGWYRVDYDNGTGRCAEGTPPFGLSDAFLTGGYAAWGVAVPEVGRLGRQIRALSLSREPAAQAFIKQNYAELLEPDSSMKGAATRLMAWPSLVYSNGKRTSK
jgi:hypothetical protein